MLIKIATTPSQIAWCQEQITREHYLHAPVDVRSRPLVYMVYIGGAGVGCLIYNRTESTRCYQGGLTYGSLDDVRESRAMYSRWEILTEPPIAEPGGCRTKGDGTMYKVGEIFKEPEEEEFDDLKEAKGHAKILSWGDCVVAIWKKGTDMPICLIIGDEEYWKEEDQ